MFITSEDYKCHELDLKVKFEWIYTLQKTIYLFTIKMLLAIV